MTDNLTLRDFLLARIEDDEKAATARVNALLDDNLLGHHPPGTNVKISLAPAGWQRELDECKAKRYVIEKLHVFAAKSDPAEYSDADELLVETLEALALPYRSHPDYNPKWAMHG